MKLRACFVIVSFLSAVVCTTSAQTAGPSSGAVEAQNQTGSSTASAPTSPPAGITGEGTKNFIPVWTGATTLGNSVIYETGGSVGIGTKTPKAPVDVVGKGNIAIKATASGTQAAIEGIATAPKGYTTGVYGQSSAPKGSGVYGRSNATTGGTGVLGVTNGTSANAFGVFGVSTSPGGVGVYGISGGTAGSFENTSGAGLILAGTSGSNYTTMFTVDASGNGFYAGNLNVTGTLTKGGGSFKIDHPLDPANKYLSHSFVESPDMMNVYNGNITTDRHGLATVNLPDYFEALNGDFRYQLTVIGQFAQAIVAKKIAANRFVIRTNKPTVEVSWQVTGIRHDAYASRYRIPVEEDKAAGEQGYYLHPEVFGQPESKAVSAARKSVPSSSDVVADASHN